MNFSNPFKVIVRPNSSKSRIIGFDENKQAYRVNIKAPAEKGKANMELIKFFSKLLKKKPEIIKGKTSREKLVKY